jgi:glycine dehydrogenase subunit 1
MAYNGCMSFISNTSENTREMLAAIGIQSESTEELFRGIPKGLRSGPLDMPAGKSEMEVVRYIGSLAKRNRTDLVTFIGGGFYDHYIPAIVDSLASRTEYVTPYTPYQPEASQGTLQSIYEFQSSICRLTGMEVANASLYDGGTAIYEAIMMALRVTRRNKVVMDSGVNPIYRKMIYSYTKNLNIEFKETPDPEGKIDRERLAGLVDTETAAVIVQNPNFFGTLDDHSDISEMCRSKGALMIETVYPVSLGIVKSPRDMGADIVVGEGQSLGIPLSFGGPYLGFMATLNKYVRKMPGRIAGRTTDSAGRTGYVLTLQTREQHIRRDRATSNICTNQALCAMRTLFFLSCYGKEGMAELAELCRQKSEYAKQKLTEIRGVELAWDTPTFNEFTLVLPKNPNEIIGKLIDKGIAAGFPLARYYDTLTSHMLVAVTEKRTKQEIGIFAELLEEALWS